MLHADHPREHVRIQIDGFRRLSVVHISGAGSNAELLTWRPSMLIGWFSSPELERTPNL